MCEVCTGESSEPRRKKLSINPLEIRQQTTTIALLRNGQTGIVTQGTSDLGRSRTDFFSERVIAITRTGVARSELTSQTQRCLIGRVRGV